MTGLIFSPDAAPSQSQLQGMGFDSAAAARSRGMVVGGPTEVKEQLGQLAAVGVQRVMLQWMDLDNIVGLTALAQAVL